MAERILQTVPEAVAGPLFWLIRSRLNRISAQFTALAARVRAGGLRRSPTPGAKPRRVAASAPDTAAPAQKTRTPSRYRHLPRTFGWLVKLVPVMRNARTQLEYLLAQPAMVELLATSPQFGRMLHPMCHMLGVKQPAPPRRPPEVAIRPEVAIHPEVAIQPEVAIRPEAATSTPSGKADLSTVPPTPSAPTPSAPAHRAAPPTQLPVPRAEPKISS